MRTIGFEFVTAGYMIIYADLNRAESWNNSTGPAGDQNCSPICFPPEPFESGSNKMNRMIKIVGTTQKNWNRKMAHNRWTSVDLIQRGPGDGKGE